MENFIDKHGMFALDKFHSEILNINENIFLICEKDEPFGSRSVTFINTKTGEEFLKGLHFTFFDLPDAYDLSTWNLKDIEKYRLNMIGSSESNYYKFFDSVWERDAIIQINSNEVIQPKNSGIISKIGREAYPNSGVYIGKTKPRNSSKKEDPGIALIYLMNNRVNIVNNISEMYIYKHYVKNDRSSDDVYIEDYFSHKFILIKIKDKGWNFLDEKGEFVWKGDEWFENAAFLPFYQEHLIDKIVGSVKYKGENKMLGKDGKLYKEQ